MSNASTAWTYETRNVTETDTSCTDGTCSSTSTSSTSRSCGTCGTESGTTTTTGTRTRSRTRTRTDERYTRAGCTSSDWTAISYTAYSDWTYTAWSYSSSTSWSGSCSESGCGGSGWVDVTQSLSGSGVISFAGSYFWPQYFEPDAWNGAPSGWLADYRPFYASGNTAPISCSGEGAYAVQVYKLYQCTATGAQCTVYQGCWTPPST